MSTVAMFREALARGVAVGEPAVPRPLDVVCRQYGGFDGVPWPGVGAARIAVQDGLASVEDWDQVAAYAATQPESDGCRTLLLAWPHSLDTDPTRREGWSLVGFDAGCFESEDSLFSVILHEVLFGRHPELRDFASTLNENLLFDSAVEASLAIARHDHLAVLGADVETAMEMEPIAVFSRAPTSA